MFYLVNYLTIRKGSKDGSFFGSLFLQKVFCFRKLKQYCEYSISNLVFFKLAAGQHLSVPSIVNRWLSWFGFCPGEHCPVALRKGHAGCSHSEKHMVRVSASVVPGMDRWMWRASWKRYAIVGLLTCPPWPSRGCIWGHHPHCWSW